MTRPKPAVLTREVRFGTITLLYYSDGAVYMHSPIAGHALLQDGEEVAS